MPPTSQPTAPSDFFTSFENLSAHIVQAATLLTQVVTINADRGALVEALKNVELQADTITHDALDRLHRSFITPLARDDIHELAMRLDDVVDYIYAAAMRIHIYQPKAIPKFVHDTVTLLGKITNTLHRAVQGMRDPKQRDVVLEACVEVNQIENAADEILREGLTTLFAEAKDPIELLKVKEILEICEDTTDRAEIAANVIQRVVLKSH